MANSPSDIGAELQFHPHTHGATRSPPLTANQWRVLAFCAIAGMLETMDMYVIAFVLAVITQPWHLSYGTSAVILFSSGIGAVCGSFVWGHVADRIGRKKTVIATIFTCSAASLALAFVPSGNWVLLAALRTLLGFGTGGFFIFVMLVQEFMPAGNRGFACGVVSTAAGGGLLLGALCASFLMPHIGWRGMFGIGALPAVLGLLGQFFIPESPRWALAHGYTDLGRRTLAWALGPSAEIERIVQAHGAVPQRPRWRQMLAHRRSFFSGALINFGVVTGYYGTVLWAPTLLSQVLGIPGSQAAKLMIGFSLAGLLCRFATGWLSDRIGRRACGAVAACGTTLCLLVAGLVGHGDLFVSALFWLPFGLAFVLADSSFAIMAMYTSEIWPSGLRGRGSGISYAIGSIGKIIGPLGLSVVVGSASLIRPEATIQSIVTAFCYLGAMFLLAGLVYVLVARETKGRTLEQIDQQLH
ncbi:MFS transporter [Pararobbsia silviterrae]|uniref:MFS transporter n=1 Tax=Pararobbsia silviterrae TaxID=1792498 RepID=A0A494Y576_9BURK|nr:MFS transporter [Pararobbsia silviterrae]RKP57846.1 MFS transporter [Pararobbsia silviterrae]